MSTSTRSKPESPSSRATGPETEGKAETSEKAGNAEKSGKADHAEKSGNADKSGKHGRGDKTPGKTSVELEPSRQRQITWAIGGVIGGILLILKLGTVGVWAGYVLIAIGLFRAYQLVMTFVNPPGTITVTDSKVVLPRGLHRGKPVEVTPKDVTAVYFLRRSVPWKHASPVLVVELGEKAMAFPRDWFATEADQRHVVHALLAHLRSDAA
jgi:hypothetical protein